MNHLFSITKLDKTTLIYCKGCKEQKDLSCFYFRKARNKPYSLCKSCVNINRKRYKANNPKAYSLISKRDRLKRVFKMSIESYNELFNKQQGCCAICKKHQSEFKKSLAVDHCHKTGAIRGLLCGKCNLGIGHLNDDIAIFENAIKYLKGKKI